MFPPAVNRMETILSHIFMASFAYHGIAVIIITITIFIVNMISSLLSRTETIFKYSSQVLIKESL